MSYSSSLPGFPINLIVGQAFRWYTVSQISSLLLSLRQVYFPITEARTTAFAVLNALTPTVPFSVYPTSVRFSATDAFCTDQNPELARIFSQLSSALSYKDRLSNTSALGVSDRSLTSITPEYQAAFRSFSSALLALTTFATNPLNFFDRATFEGAFCLTWA